MKYTLDDSALKNYNMYYTFDDIERIVNNLRNIDSQSGLVIEDGAVTGIELSSLADTGGCKSRQG